MLHLIRYDNNEYTGFEEPVADNESPFEEWKDCITKIVQNFLSK